MTPSLKAQEFERVVEGIPIVRNGEIAAFPFLGGLDVFLPQFVDIDGDGDRDLFVAESNSVNALLSLVENRGTPQTPDLHWRDTAYDTLRIGNWFHFVDIDADGDPDLYCADSGGDDLSSRGGLRFYRNTGTPAEPRFVPEAEEVRDSNGIKVASEPTSIPTFADIDADGDFDFFTGVSTGTIRLYRNTGSPAAPVFTFETETWQNLVIISGGRTSARLVPADQAAANRHGANGICFADVDRDGDQDFFYGDLFHNSVYFLRNSGTPQVANVSITDTLFPRPQEVQTAGFNIPRFADLSAGGEADFFAACIRQGQNNFLYYRNAGAAAQPQFQRQRDNFLTMLDLGSANMPALADLDADGDRDLLMGDDRGYFIFYRNTGTAQAPFFEWESDNFQNLHSGRLFIAAPTFVDIDNDGDVDLFSSYYLGRIAFYENRGTPQQASFVLVTDAFEGIDVGDQSTPHFADIDGDGDYDLFSGEARRNILYLFENTGNAGQPDFTLRKEIRFPITIEESVPFTYDWNRDGRLDMFLGNHAGTIVYFQGTSQPDSFIFVEDNFAGIDVGFASAPLFTDLDQDGKIDLLVGERAGGLNFYRGNRSAAAPPQREQHVPPSFELLVYPNPMKNLLKIILHTASGQKPAAAPTLTIYNVLGERVGEAPMLHRGADTWLAEWRPAARQLAAGLYFARANWGSMQITRKLLLAK